MSAARFLGTLRSPTFPKEATSVARSGLRSVLLALTVIDLKVRLPSFAISWTNPAPQEKKPSARLEWSGFESSGRVSKIEAVLRPAT